MISLADSSLIVDNDWKQELLEQAFYLAGKAKHPLPLQQVEGFEVDTRAGLLSYALSQQVDTLSLRTETLRALVKVNAVRAKELLIEMLPLKIAPVACEQATSMGKIEPFYQVAGLVIQKGFTAEERERSLPLELLERLIGEATHPLQIKGTLALILSFGFETDLSANQSVLTIRNPDQFVAQKNRLLSRWQEALRTGVVDARSFALAYSSREFIIEFGKVLVEYRRLKQPMAEVLLSGRQWLARQFSQHTCRATTRVTPDVLPVALQNYNGFLALSERPLELMTVEEFQSVAPKQSAVAHRYWQTPQTKALLLSLKSLRFGSMEKQIELKNAGKPIAPLSVAERETLDWHRQLNEFLQDLEKWKPEDEASPLDYFHQRCITYGAVIELTPAGSMRERLLGEYLNFLQTQRWQNESFVEWLWHVRQLPKRAGAADQRWVHEAYANALDNVLQLLAKRDKLLGTKTTPQK